MPNSQTNLRLDAAIKAAAVAASEDSGIPLARWIERAILAYLGSSDGAAAGADSVPGAGADSVSGAAEIAALAARIERLETRLEAGAGAGAAVNDSGAGAGEDSGAGAGGGTQLGTHGYTMGEALIQAGARITESQAMGSNRNRAMATAHGVSAKEFLESQGWQLRGRRWWPPSV